VLAVSSSLKIPMQTDVARSNAKKIAIDEARRHVTKPVNLEFSNSQHASGMDGIEILYRGKSFSGNKGRKMFSEIMIKILDDGKQICIDYDTENRRCIVLMEYDLSPFDK
jgi:hypothetical protein